MVGKEPLMPTVLALSFPGLSWLVTPRGHQYNAHPLASLVVLVVVLALVTHAFRRKPV
jgi:hypothetical protein